MRGPQREGHVGFSLSVYHRFKFYTLTLGAYKSLWEYSRPRRTYSLMKLMTMTTMTMTDDYDDNNEVEDYDDDD